MEIDSYLITKCMDADKRAQQALFEACFPFLMRICRTYSRDDQEAMAQLNEGFYKIIKGLSSWKQHIPFENWAKRVMLNVVIDNFRKQMNYKQQMQVGPEELLLLESRMNPVQVADTEIDADQMLAWMRDLPELTSKIFGLYAVEGYSYEEISNWLEMKQVTVRWHVWEARKKLSVRYESVMKIHQKNL